MGSSGSGRFSDLPGSGKPANSDKCGDAFSVKLEDVERSEYYTNHGSPPPVGTKLLIAREKRIVAKTQDGETIGNLPTNHSYLAACLTSGYAYAGEVTDAGKGPPVATVIADFLPSATP